MSEVIQNPVEQEKLAKHPKRPEDVDYSEKDPADKEKKKTPQQKAEDISYTINHAIVCGMVDLGVLPFSHDIEHFLDKKGVTPAIKKGIMKVITLGHPDDHDHGGGGCSAHPKGSAEARKNDRMAHLKEYFKGEVYGDFGAVFATVGIQRFAPGFMEKINKTFEPAIKPLFMWNAKRSATYWARSNNLPISGEEYERKVEQLYKHERDHFAQALVWTLTSSALNIGIQSRSSLRKKELGQSFLDVLVNVGTTNSIKAGAVFTAVVGGRAVAPQTAKNIDGFTSTHIFAPVVNTVGGIFGLEYKPEPHIHGTEAFVSPDQAVSQKH